VAEGRLLWRVNYTNDFGAIFIGEKGATPGAARHGNNGAPLIDGEHLVACVGGTNGAGVVCFDKRSGKIVWKSQHDQAAFAPPNVATLADVRQVLAFTGDGLIGLGRDNGELLWRVPIKTAFARHVTIPVVHGDLVIVSSHQAGLIATRVLRDGARLKAERAWVSTEAAMNFASPVVVGEHLYGLGPAKNLVCVHLPTGRLAWTKDGYFTTSADKTHAAFLVMDKNVLMLTDGGELVLFAAEPSAFKEISRVQVCGLNWCNPAYADGRLYLRDGLKSSGGDLLCVRLLD
jgi:outer membrane protein assembly factor BamB